MKIDSEPQSIADIVKAKQPKKPPAFEWQDLALRVIEELKAPNFKRSSVFKVCKNNSKQEILNALNDTKELCKSGAKWKYFFKVISDKKDDKKED